MNNKIVQRVTLLALLVGLVAAFKYLGFGHYLTLAFLKESHLRFADLYTANRAAVIAGYMAVYIVVTALSLPGASIMTLAGGALFGLTVGTVIVSFASSIGATLACLSSRFLLRDWVQGRFGDKLGRINQGIQEEGAYYLFSLRLVPVFPFFVINLVFGLTKMPLVTFYWVSQLGMLAGTLVYVNAGKELAQIDALAGILSPGLILSFVLLGLFPVTVKKLQGWYRDREAVTGDKNHGKV
jgi:uncharacterized membrane protein YdjX (TVP38/TMEM64 family)